MPPTKIDSAIGDAAQAGADPNHQDAIGETALMETVRAPQRSDRWRLFWLVVLGTNSKSPQKSWLKTKGIPTF